MAHPKKTLMQKTAKLLKRYGYRAEVEEEEDDDWTLYVWSVGGEAGDGFFQASFDGDEDYRGQFAILLTNPDKDWEYPGIGEEQALGLAEVIVHFDAGHYVDLIEDDPARFKRWVRS